MICAGPLCAATERAMEGSIRTGSSTISAYSTYRVQNRQIFPEQEFQENQVDQAVASDQSGILDSRQIPLRAA